MSWKPAKTPKPCNAFPLVWAAIVGCTGKGEGAVWRRTGAHFGTRGLEYACPTCRAAKDRLDPLQGPLHQDALRALQAAAGVADYRVAEVAFENGRPVLTGKVDKGLANDAAYEAISSWLQGASIDRAARAILVYAESHGAGTAEQSCTALVDSFRLTPVQRRNLRAAYCAAKRSA